MAATATPELPAYDPAIHSDWGSSPLQYGKEPCKVLWTQKNMDYIAILHQEIGAAHRIMESSIVALRRDGDKSDLRMTKNILAEMIKLGTFQAKRELPKMEPMVRTTPAMPEYPDQTVLVEGNVEDAEFSYNILQKRYELTVTVNYPAHPPLDIASVLNVVVRQPCHRPASSQTQKFYAPQIYDVYT